MYDAEAHRISRWIDEYGQRLWLVARAFSRDGDEAEDLLQEMWIVAFRRQHTLRDGAPVGAWLHRILLNLGRAHRRKTTRRVMLTGKWGQPTAAVQSPPGMTSVAREHMKTILWREIAELPELQRQVLLLRIVEGMSTAECADAIGRAEGTVKASLHRALMRLEARLKKCGVDPSIMSKEW